jgi:hypothetical protein
MGAKKKLEEELFWSHAEMQVLEAVILRRK